MNATVAPISTPAIPQATTVVEQKPVATKVQPSPNSQTSATASPLAAAIFAARQALNAGPIENPLANFFAKMGELLITENKINDHALAEIQGILNDAKTVDKPDLDLGNFLQRSQDIKILDQLKTFLSENLPKLKAEDLQALKVHSDLTAMILKANPAAVLIKTLNPKEFGTMGNAIKYLAEKSDYEGDLDPRSSPETFKNFSTELAGIIQEARNMHAMNPGANITKFYVQKLQALGLKKDLLLEIHQELVNHSKKTPEMQKESLDFMGSIVEKLRESAPYALVPALVSLCTSMVSWLPWIGPPIAQMASAVTQPLMSVIVAQMASGFKKPHEAIPAQKALAA